MSARTQTGPTSQNREMSAEQSTDRSHYPARKHMGSMVRSQTGSTNHNTNKFNRPERRWSSVTQKIPLDRNFDGSYQPQHKRILFCRRQVLLNSARNSPTSRTQVGPTVWNAERLSSETWARSVVQKGVADGARLMAPKPKPKP